MSESGHKPNYIWVDKYSEFYNRSIKSGLLDTDIEMRSTHNEEKSVGAGRFIRTLKNKIYKSMTSISKNMYINKLDDKVKEYSNTYHRTIKMKSVNVKSCTYIDLGLKNNENDPKFQNGDRVRISKYKKSYTANWSEEVFMNKKFKIL